MADVETQMLKIKYQLLQLKTLEDPGTEDAKKLREKYCEQLNNHLGRLRAADANLRPLAPLGARFSTASMPKHFSPEKLQYAFLSQRLNRMVKELIAWQISFDPMWFIICEQKKTSLNPAPQALPAAEAQRVDGDIFTTIQNVLKPLPISDQSVFRPRHYVSEQVEILEYSTARISRLTKDGALVIVDTTQYPPQVDIAQTREHVRDLARILSNTGSVFLGLLRCLGVLEDQSPMRQESEDLTPQFQYIFEVPQGHSTNPSSLRRLLQNNSPSLDAKYHIARTLARGVAAVHCSGFVHKNIRPENILILQSKDQQDLRACLIGFERSRPTSAGTALVGDMLWYKNLYRHPSRQGSRPEQSYSTKHDIYSLGICLLELGIWSTPLHPASDQPRQGSLFEGYDLEKREQASNTPWVIKDFLTQQASELLPSIMGMLYTEVVLLCLTCLDSGFEEGQGDNLRDVDGILVGVAFIRMILSRLYESPI